MSATFDLDAITSAWERFSRRTHVGVIRSPKEYTRMVALMDHLVDEVGGHEAYRLAGLLGVVATLVKQYEQKHVRLPVAQPRDALRFLIDQHGLRQSDLRAELGSQGVVSEILAGKRDINARQARALAARFHVSSTAFL